ncbi:MptD family putative ECF transporter S component [Peptacetobacter sp.]|uniref:MptD family putative ECF transporter S component n=1 Tax=Peptacetobacter sp. TaxID=2991975 RepID=UPI002616B0EB|nr:MptD family putative ECF transporter S component [Peptacetobacter sp.]
MKLKDFITVSLLGVIAFIISMIGGMVTQLFGMYGIFIHVSIGSLLCAPIYFVMCHKIQKRGSAFIYNLVRGIVYAIMGFLPMTAVMAISGIIGELAIGKTENYKNDRRITISYIISEVIYALHGFFFILILGVDGLAKTFPNLFSVEKAQAVHNIFFNPKNMFIILIIEIIAALIGTLFGKYVNQKFFNKNNKHEGVL